MGIPDTLFVDDPIKEPIVAPIPPQSNPLPIHPSSSFLAYFPGLGLEESTVRGYCYTSIGRLPELSDRLLPHVGRSRGGHQSHVSGKQPFWACHRTTTTDISGGDDECPATKSLLARSNPIPPQPTSTKTLFSCLATIVRGMQGTSYPCYAV